MASQRAWKDEYTLLCERCGYVIEGLPRDGACPECAKPIVESLPERRIGSKWQAGQGRHPLLHNWVDTFASPHQVLDRMSFEQRSKKLRDRYLLSSATIFALLAGSALAVNLWPSSPKAPGLIGSLVLVIVVALVSFLAAYAGLALLTAIESAGLVILSARHRFRLGKTVAANICDHGAAGWILAVIGIAIPGLVLAFLEAQPNRMLPKQLWLIPIASALPGFLFFETFAWLGLRRLKYANTARPAANTG